MTYKPLVLFRCPISLPLPFPTVLDPLQFLKSISKPSPLT